MKTVEDLNRLIRDEIAAIEHSEAKTKKYGRFGGG